MVNERIDRVDAAVTSVGVLLALSLTGTARAGESLPKSTALLEDLKTYPCKVVYETYRQNNWELFLVNADGSNPVNLTRTPDVDEMSPKASPDGKKLAFVVDEGEGKSRVRNLCLMNIDGTGRVKIADCARQPCWNADGTVIAYLKGIPRAKTTVYRANKGLFFYDLKTGKHRQHVNKDIKQILCIALTPDSKWFVSSAVGGLGYGHSIIAFEANGNRHCELIRAEKLFWQCRPDLSYDGKMIAYGRAVGSGPNKNLGVEVGRLDFSSGIPKLKDLRWVCAALDPIEVYHADWSPDGKYILCSWGPMEKSKMKTARYVIGVKAPGWDICVVDANGYQKWHAITGDGLSNKEPEWVPVGAAGGKVR